MAVTVKITIFWDVKLFSLPEIHSPFSGTCYEFIRKRYILYLENGGTRIQTIKPTNALMLKLHFFYTLFVITPTCFDLS
jgi:hypothetical protein